MLTEIAPILKELGLNAVPVAIATLILNDKLQKTTNPIKNAVIEIQTTLRNNCNMCFTHNLVEQPGSPLKLTEYGMNLIRKSGLYKIIEDNKERLLKALNDKLSKIKSKTSYDVQEYAREVLTEHKDSSFMAPVKEYAFQNAINVEIILRGGGLVLRDLYLETHKNEFKK